MLCFSAGLLFKAETSLSSLLRQPLAKHLPRLAPTNNSSLSCAGLCDQLRAGYVHCSLHRAAEIGMEFYCHNEQNMCHKNVSTAWLCLPALYSLNLSPCRAQANAGRVPGPARLAALTDGCRAAGRRPALAGRDGRRRQLWRRRRVWSVPSSPPPSPQYSPDPQ